MYPILSDSIGDELWKTATSRNSYTPVFGSSRHYLWAANILQFHFPKKKPKSKKKRKHERGTSGKKKAKMRQNFTQPTNPGRSHSMMSRVKVSLVTLNTVIKWRWLTSSRLVCIVSPSQMCEKYRTNAWIDPNYKIQQTKWRRTVRRPGQNCVYLFLLFLIFEVATKENGILQGVHWTRRLRVLRKSQLYYYFLRVNFNLINLQRHEDGLSRWKLCYIYLYTTFAKKSPFIAEARLFCKRSAWIYRFSRGRSFSSAVPRGQTLFLSRDLVTHWCPYGTSCKTAPPYLENVGSLRIATENRGHQGTCSVMLSGYCDQK